MISLTTQSDGSPSTRIQAVVQPSPARVVPKPVPQAQLRDPRGYQVEAIRKRFKPSESTTADGATSLVFKLKPSDPDFPFELVALECDIHVPQAYPEERPQLRVRNKDIPRGFSINIERGFARLAEEKKESTLLALVYALDRNLEGFLSEQKVETVKLVPFKDTRHLDAAVDNLKGKAAAPPSETEPVPVPQVARPYVPEPSYSRQQIYHAKLRRAQEIRQLESRMGRLPQFRRSADGVIFTLPIEPKRRADLPQGLHSVNSIHLIIPLLYPLQQLRVQLNEADASDAEPVEDLFAERAAGQSQMTLMSHVNYLAQNLHLLAKQARALANDEQTKISSELKQQQQQQQQQEKDQSEDVPVASSRETKGHIQVIQRPPEWTLPTGDDDSEDDSSEYDDDEGEGGGAALEEGADSAPMPQREQVEHGTMISFPSIELIGVELLQISLLSLSVKCERCKTLNDMTGLKPGFEKTTSCRKCAVPLAAKFNQQLLYENSARAGFIDLSGCKVADMLPSTFVPTCSRCSTPSAGLVSVRGETTTNVCRECHGRFTFKIAQVKFVFVSPGSLPPPDQGGMRRRQQQERLGLHAGEPLPGRGACEHYRKSFRWFRFGCCSRVHPCDRCHDAAEDHLNEWANRMICGWCSREQNYAVEACLFCGRSVIGKKGRGFWEGGKGTRDQRMMSRKDPRKYKRLGKKE
ncbi:Uncharacterized protein ESCO_003870 [Escovopsis weberi]|uniref:CHY-type domain-containing protein n=1 Tax=Escovopsis weberi TaxID=150374 RepID=A0A0M8N010_ESCWE|nr:Uncharacterized protein ESCO_003870 [Escovopsis weberi]